MNKVLTNYCYSWYRTVRTNVLTEEATADHRPRATARPSTEGDSPTIDRGRQPEGVPIELSDN